MASVFKDHFSAVASNYAEFRPAYPHKLFEWLASLADRRNMAWDCATGNGQAAVHLSQLFQKVIATDASAEQVANAEERPNVQYMVASAEKSDLASHSVDLITVAQAAHWFDLDKFYAEVRRVARTPAILAVWCYSGIDFADRSIQELLEAFYRDIVGPYWPPERRWVEDRYRTLSFPFEEIAAPEFLMQAELTLDRFLGYLRTWSATQRFVRAKGFDPVKELEQRLTVLWPKSGTPESRWPIYLRVGRIGIL